MLANMCELKIVAVYDVCRQDIATAQSLKRGEKFKLFDSGAELMGDEYCYMHICTQPLKLVDANSILCELIEKRIDETAKKEKGIVEMPSVFLTLPGVEKTMNGGVYTLPWNNKKQESV